MQGFINQLISCKQTIQQMGVQYCSVKDCKSTSTCRDVHFFAFPKNILNSEWIAVVNKAGWVPKKTSKICSLHFSPHHIRGRKRKILIQGAVPSADPQKIFSSTVLLGN